MWTVPRCRRFPPDVFSDRLDYIVSHQLLALDDEEFYEKQRPLKLEEVRQLAGFLKEWLCR